MIKTTLRGVNWSGEWYETVSYWKPEEMLRNESDRELVTAVMAGSKLECPRFYAHHPSLILELAA